MILRGIQIQRCGHGKCGLLSDQTLSRNLAELQPFGVLALILMSICSGVLSLSSSPRQAGRSSMYPTGRTGSQFM